MGWGEAHTPAPAPVATTGTSREIELAVLALDMVGVRAPNLALAAIEAAGEVDRLRHLVVRILAGSRSHGHRAAIHEAVDQAIDRLLGTERAAS